MSSVANPINLRIELVGTFILNSVYVNCYSKAVKYIAQKPDATLEEAYASCIQSYYKFVESSDGYRTHLDNLLDYLQKY